MKRFIAAVMLVSMLLASADLMAQKNQSKTKPAAKAPDKTAQTKAKERVLPGVICNLGFYKYENTAANSITAMSNAFGHDFYGTHFTVRLTGDHQIIVYDRPDLEGLIIEETPYKEVVNHPAAKFRDGSSIPHFEHFLNAAKKEIGQQQNLRKTSTRLICEIKAPMNIDFCNILIEEVLKGVEALQLHDYVTFASDNSMICKTLASRVPDMPIAFMGEETSPADLAAMGVSVMFCSYKTILNHREWVDEAHKRDMKIYVGIVDDPNVVRELRELNVDAISTDLPLEMQEWLEKK